MMIYLCVRSSDRLSEEPYSSKRLVQYLSNRMLRNRSGIRFPHSVNIFMAYRYFIRLWVFVQEYKFAEAPTTPKKKN